MGGRGAGSGMKSKQSLLRAIDNTITNPIPRVSVEAKKTALDYWSKLDWKTKRDAPIERVPMSDIRAWQGHIRQDTLRDIATGNSQYNPSTDAPMGLRMGNQVIVMDGNHRVAVGYLRGDSSVNIRVVDYVPNKRKKR